MTDRRHILRALDELSPRALEYFFPGLIINDLRKPCCLSFRGELMQESDMDFAPISEVSCFAEMSISEVPAAPCVSADERTDEVPEELADMVMKELEDIQRRYGVTIEQIEAVLSYKVKLSHLRITCRKEIILDDFDFREVRMDTLTKAVYLLFLRHPEGIYFKDLTDYKNELYEIYSSISGRTDPDAMVQSIDRLTDPYDNSINEKSARIKMAFVSKFNDELARWYYIDGRKGEKKRIRLPRELVTVESQHLIVD